MPLKLSLCNWQLAENKLWKWLFASSLSGPSKGIKGEIQQPGLCFPNPNQQSRHQKLRTNNYQYLKVISCHRKQCKQNTHKTWIIRIESATRLRLYCYHKLPLHHNSQCIRWQPQAYATTCQFDLPQGQGYVISQIEMVLSQIVNRNELWNAPIQSGFLKYMEKHIYEFER